MQGSILLQCQMRAHFCRLTKPIDFASLQMEIDTQVERAA